MRPTVMRVPVMRLRVMRPGGIRLRMWSPATRGESGTCENGGMTSTATAPALWDPDVFTSGPPHEFLAELRRTQPV